jgi:hypothetical protein
LHLSPLAGLTASSSDIALEPTGLIPSFPTIRPTDISLQLIPGCRKTTSSQLLIDVTFLPMIHVDPQMHDSLTTPVVHLHIKHENNKFTGKHGRYNSTQLRSSIQQEILDICYVLLPFTFDPGGQIGPLATSFLWSSFKSPSTCLSSKIWPSTNLTTSLAQDLHDISIKAYTHLGFLQKADIGWPKEHHNQWFTRSYTATLPSYWATQVISQNLTMALLKHIQSLMSKIRYIHPSQSHRLLHAATSAPRFKHSTFACSSAYCVASALPAL